MPATATELNNKTQHSDIEDQGQENKPTRKGNPLIRSLTPEMITSPHALDFADGMMSHEFAWEKVSKQILEPLGITTEKEWMDFNKNVWRWHCDKEIREAEAEADEILAKLSDNPKALEFLKKKIEQSHKAA